MLIQSQEATIENLKLRLEMMQTYYQQ
jgi:hypothetical protein